MAWSEIEARIITHQERAWVSSGGKGPYRTLVLDLEDTELVLGQTHHVIGSLRLRDNGISAGEDPFGAVDSDGKVRAYVAEDFFDLILSWAFQGRLQTVQIFVKDAKDAGTGNDWVRVTSLYFKTKPLPAAQPFAVSQPPQISPPP